MNRQFTADEVIDELQKRIDAAGSLQQFADLHNISSETIRLILKKRRPPSGKTLKIIGYRKAELYEAIT